MENNNICSDDIKVGDKIKLNNEGISYLIDLGFKVLPEVLTVEDKIFRGNDVYFLTYETGNKTLIMIGEIQEIVK